jgi:anti-anti-sigma factor
MELSQEQYADVTVLTARGRVDHATAAEFQDVLLGLFDVSPEARKGVVVDLAGVDYISSVGLRALMIGNKRSKEGTCKLVVASPSEFVRDVFEVARLDRIIDIQEDLRGAIGSVSEAAARDYDQA